MRVYKRYRNKLNHSLHLAKRSYYEAKLKSLTANIKGTWNILNQIINRTRRPNKLPSTFVVSNNQDISDPCLIANQFCNFFTNLGPSLARKIPTSVKSYRFFLPERSFSSFEFRGILKLSSSLASAIAFSPSNTVRKSYLLYVFSLFVLCAQNREYVNLCCLSSHKIDVISIVKINAKRMQTKVL